MFWSPTLQFLCKKSIPGWSDFVSDARAAASDAHNIWQQWKKPKNGPVFELMQRTRAQYKYAIRFCRKNEKRIQADTLASSLSGRNYNSFWKTVSRTVAPNATYPSKVGSAVGSDEICRLWYNHYKSLFSSVGYDTVIIDNMLNNGSISDANDICYTTGAEVRKVLSAMCNNKAGDCYSLHAENYKLAGDLFYSFLALCFNVMFTHGYIPVDATQTIICPCIKDKNCDLSEISNYRPTALATIFSKIYERVL